MADYQWITDEFVPAFCRMLLHSLWMGVAAALLTVVIIVATENTSAATRYNWLVALLGVVVLATSVIFFSELKIVSKIEVSSTHLVDDKETIHLLTSSDSFITDNANPFSTIISSLDKNSIGIVSFWFFIFLFKMVRMAFGLQHIHILQRRKVYPVDEKWVQWIKEKSAELGIQKAIIFLQSELVKIPVAVGYLKPVILVPFGLLSHLSPQQVESILIHELAHIKRKDYLVNLLQSFIDAIFFFNPGFIWLSSLIRQEREKCCDDIAVEYSTRMDYLEALMSFQNIHHKGNFTMALGTEKHLLLNRIKRILSRKNSRLSRGEIYSLVLAVVITTFSFMAFKPKPNNPAKSFVQKEIGTEIKKNLTAIMPLEKKKINASYKPVFNKHTNSGSSTLITSKFNHNVNNTLALPNRDTVTPPAYDTEVGILKGGQTYMIRRKENEIINLHLDGKEIPKQEYSNYSTLIEGIEKNRRHIDSAKKAREVRRNEMEQRKQNMDVKHAAMQGEITKRNHYMDSSRKATEDRRDAMLIKHAEIEGQFAERKKHWDSLNSVMDESRNAAKNSAKSEFRAVDIVLSSVINDLVANNIIFADSQFSFSLTYDLLIVNGISQSAAVLKKFVYRYLKNSNNYIKYSNVGGKTRIESYIQ